ncbi:MAG: hypothetical protein HXL58_10050 [Solobacterium sp.]|nr:hypothetical protein [Solobacterium sp.]
MHKTSTKVLISGFLLILFASICISIYLFVKLNTTISIGKGHYLAMDSNTNGAYNMEIYDDHSVKIFLDKVYVEGTLEHEQTQYTDSYYIQTKDKKYLMNIYHDTVSVPIEVNGNLVSLVFKYVSNVPFTQIDLPQK